MVHPKSRQLIVLVFLTILIAALMLLLTMMTQLSAVRLEDVGWRVTALSSVWGG